MNADRKRSRHVAAACPAGSAPRNAFTLIEVLVVIVILGVLVALVVGVSRYITDKAAHDNTVSIQTILTSAINVYHQAQGEYPVEDTSNPPVPTSSGTYGYRFATDQWQAVVRNRSLWSQLSGEPASAKVIQKLPTDAMYPAERLFRDGYGRDLDYRQSAGLGGTPVVISPGADGRFYDPSKKVDYETDNIRSDGKGQ